MKVLMHALAASCEELRARTGNPPLCSIAAKQDFHPKQDFQNRIVDELGLGFTRWGTVPWRV